MMEKFLKDYDGKKIELNAGELFLVALVIFSRAEDMGVINADEQMKVIKLFMSVIATCCDCPKIAKETAEQSRKAFEQSCRETDIFCKACEEFGVDKTKN